MQRLLGSLAVSGGKHVIPPFDPKVPHSFKCYLNLQTYCFHWHSRARIPSHRGWNKGTLAGKLGFKMFQVDFCGVLWHGQLVDPFCVAQVTGAWWRWRRRVQVHGVADSSIALPCVFFHNSTAMKCMVMHHCQTPSAKKHNQLMSIAEEPKNLCDHHVTK